MDQGGPAWLPPVWLPPERESWATHSPKAVVAGRVIACASAACTVGAVFVNLTALLRAKPIHGVGVLLVPAIPVLIVGQLWAIAVIGGGRTRRPLTWQGRSLNNARSFFFKSLPRKIATPLLCLAFLGWLSAMTAAVTTAPWGPASPGDGCAYRLGNHGSYKCVSHAEYDRTAAGVQRFASGILLGFFTLHTGAALGEVHRRRTYPK